MALIYHITSRAEWEHAQQTGEHRAESLAAQGFIHCSTREQVTRVADVVFRGQQGLLLLGIDPDKLTAALRFEAADTTIHVDHTVNEQFPHLYGALNIEAVVRVADFVPQTDGTFAFPQALDG